MKKENSRLSKSAIGSLKPQNSWMTSAKKKPKLFDCYGVLESVAWIWRMLGLFPISMKSSIDTRRYDLNKFYAVYSFFLIGICMVNFTYGLTRFTEFSSIHLSITTATILIRTIASTICMMFSHIYRVIRFKGLSESINKMSEQEMILEKTMNCRFNYVSSARIIRAYVSTTFVIISILMFYDMFASIGKIQDITIQWLLWILPLMMQVMDLTVFVSLVGLLGLKFRAINEKIRIVVTRANASSPKVIVTSDVCAENLRLLSRAHYNICAIGKRINRAFDWNLVINVATAFIILSTTLYYIFYEIHNEQKTHVIRIVSYIHWEIIHSIPIIIVVITCNWTTRQATLTGKLIHEFRVESTDSRLYETIKSFSLQLHHQKLQFTARGFFPINSILLQTMVGNITTFLVILIQFEPRLE